MGVLEDYQQSVLWRCMNDKICANLNFDLEKIVERHSERYDFDLYRGVSNSLLMKMYDLTPGDMLTLDRVTSFSEDFNIARQFASFEIYGTKTILHVTGGAKAFPYHKYMKNILLAAPDTEFSGPNKQKHRLDNVDMIENEQEWMIQTCTTLELYDIVDDTSWPSGTGVTIYKMKVRD